MRTIRLATTVNKYVAAANSVNKYIAAAKEAEQAARREAQAAIAAAKAKEEHNAAIERQYALVRQSAWKEYAASIGKQSEEMQKLSAYYREQERAAEALDAQRINEAAKANQYLARETEKLVFINEKLAQGFSTATANALFKYQEALLKTGRTADQVEKILDTEKNAEKRKEVLADFQDNLVKKLEKKGVILTDEEED